MKKTMIGWTGGALLLVGLTGGAVVWGMGAGDAPAPESRTTQEMGGMDHSGMHMHGMEMHDMDMGGSGTVRIDVDMARSLGVTWATAELGPLRREIRTTGNVIFDETRLSTITPRIGGFVEELHVDFVGQNVRSGQPLLEIYSPELVAAQEELLAAVRLEEQLARSSAPGVGARTGTLIEASRRRLVLWDISPAQIQHLEETGEVRRTMTLHAPSTGFVVEKDVQEGASVQAGQALYHLADLSEVWVEADIYEQDLQHVRAGEPAEIELGAFPGERFTGRVGYVYPDVRPETRTGRVRIQLSNPGGRIKPGMFATVYLDTPGVERALLIPRDAVMRTGTRDIVFVQQEPGVYEARDVRVGDASGDRVQILSGLLAGEQVVARANFILDAESRLMETMMGQPGMPGMDDMDMGGGGMHMPGMGH